MFSGTINQIPIGSGIKEITRCLPLRRKTMTNLDSILKSREITLPTKVHLVKSMVFFSSHVWMWELDYKESWALNNWCFWTVVLEKTLENPLNYKEIKPRKSIWNINRKNWCWRWNSKTLATWCEELTLWKRLWCWERLKVGGEGDDRGWDGLVASPTWWTWVWVSSKSWWWKGKSGRLQSTEVHRVGYNWATELNW